MAYGLPSSRKKVFLTSRNDDHRHNWSPTNKYTSVTDDHKHIINLKKKLAEWADGHTHKLLHKLSK